MINLFIMICASFTNPFEMLYTFKWNEDEKVIIFGKSLLMTEWCKGYDVNDPNKTIVDLKLPHSVLMEWKEVPYHGGAKFYSLKDGSRIDNRYFAADEFLYERIYIFPKEWIKEVDKRTGRAEITIPKGRYLNFVKSHANRFCVVLED